MIGDGVENGDENITSLNNPKVIPGSRQTEGCNKDSLPFSNPSSCVVSSGFEQKNSRKEMGGTQTRDFNGPFTPDIKRVEDRRIEIFLRKHPRVT